MTYLSLKELILKNLFVLINMVFMALTTRPVLMVRLGIRRALMNLPQNPHIILPGMA
jgi:hypothetical protein